MFEFYYHLYLKYLHSYFYYFVAFTFSINLPELFKNKQFIIINYHQNKVSNQWLEIQILDSSISYFFRFWMIVFLFSKNLFSVESPFSIKIHKFKTNFNVYSCNQILISMNHFHQKKQFHYKKLLLFFILILIFLLNLISKFLH